MSEPKSLPTLTLTVSPHRAPEVVRTIEVRTDQKLRALHETIAEEFNLGEASAWRVFLSNRAWDRANELRSEGRGANGTFASLGVKPGARFLLVEMDAAEQWYRCEVTADGTTEAGVKYPRVLDRTGEAPDLLPDFGMLFMGEEDSEGPMAPAPKDAEAKALFKDTAQALADHDAHFENEDAAETPRERAHVERDLALAKRIAIRFGDDTDTFTAWAVDLEGDAQEWLEMLPFDLEDHGMIGEAVALCDAIALLLDASDVWMSKAQLLSRAGRLEEACAQAERTVDAYPDDPEVRVRAAQVFFEGGDPVRAEDLARSVLEAELEGRGATLYADAIETLGNVLRATGREAEATALETSEQAERARVALDEEDEDEGAENPFDLLGQLGLGAPPASAAPKSAVRSNAPKDRSRKG